MLALRARVDAARLFLLANLIGGSIVGGLYLAAEPARADLPPTATASDHGAPVEITTRVAADELPPIDVAVIAPAEVDEAGELPRGIDVPDEVAALVDAYAEELLDPATGVWFGPVTIVPTPEPVATEVSTPRRAARPRVMSAPTAPIVRLDPNPGRHVILTARGMIARGETVRGSCYRFLSEVFARAGHEGWRTRAIIHSSRREGPYANLDLIRPGDWLYIVNHPEATPMGTHSVLFVGWEDRASGYARVIEHPGWGAGATTGQERGYDVSRTYRIVRPIVRAE